MERLLQYLDDLDDLYGMVGLIVERLRRFSVKLAIYSLAAVVATGSVWFAQLHPPIATAVATMMFVMLLYRSVTVPSAAMSPAA